MRIGYLVNQYPKISHTFIRSEIAGLEAAGTEVVRFAIRQNLDELVDPVDRNEASLTRVITDTPVLCVAQALGRAVMRPTALASAFDLATRMGIASDRGLMRHYAYLAEACVLKEWALEESVVHIHAHFGTNSAAVALLCHTLGGPTYSFTVHGPEEFEKVEAISLPRKLSHALFTVAVSDFGRSQLWRYCTAENRSKIFVVRCGVDRSYATTARRDIPPAPSLVCVGRISAQKGHFLLLQAAANLKESGQEFRLAIIGDGELRSEIESEIGRLGLQGNVEISGWQTGEQVRKHIRESRALVLPSFAEGLPVVIMEAMSLYRPVISTYVAGIPELVVDGANGWLIPAGAVTPLVDAMRDALNAKPAQLEKMGQHGYTAVRNRHDANTNALVLNELFQNALMTQGHSA